jgi:D-amino peptidase
MRQILAVRALPAVALAVMLASAVSIPAQTSKPKKVFMITDMEGVGGVFNAEDQVNPFTSPRWEESRKLLTGEINAAVAGLYEGGADDVVVLDGHDSGRTLSVLDMDPRVRLVAGGSYPPTLGLDASYAALIFIGQHAMAGAKNGVLSHTESIEGVQNMWVNGKLVGEIGINLLLASHFGIPTIMLSGDTAACEELHDLVPLAECAAVKSGFSRTSGIALSHLAACALIREKARSAMKSLAEFRPYQISKPVELKIEYTPRGTRLISEGGGVERVDDRTWIFRGADFLDVWEKFLGR